MLKVLSTASLVSRCRILTGIVCSRTNDSGVHHVQLDREQGDSGGMQGSWDPCLWDTLGLRACRLSSLVDFPSYRTLSAAIASFLTHLFYPSNAVPFSNECEELVTNHQSSCLLAFYIFIAVSSPSMPSTCRIHSYRTVRVVLLYPVILVASTSHLYSSYPHLRVSTFITSHPTSRIISSS